MRIKQVSNRCHAGVLVVVLCLILVAAAMTSGWISVMSAQIGYSETYFATAKRRVSQGNAVALVRQYVLDQVVTKSSAPGVSAAIGSGWGSVVIGNTGIAPLTTFQKPAGVNHFAPGRGDGYAMSVPTTLDADGISSTATVWVKSHSSVLGGSPLVLNTPSAGQSGNLLNASSTLFWNSLTAIAGGSLRYFAPSEPEDTILNLANAATMPSNFPFAPITGSETSGVPDYAGGLNVIENATGINSLAGIAVSMALNGVQIIDGSVESDVNGVVCDGEGEVTVNLANPALGNVILRGNVTTLVFDGQSSEADRVIAGNAAAILVVLAQTTPPTNLPSISFRNSNNRKLVLAIKSPAASAVAFNFPEGAGSSWRLVLTLESTIATLDIGGGTMQLVGGIQSDQSITVVNGTLEMIREPDPKLMERLTAREAWVEVFVP